MLDALNAFLPRSRVLGRMAATLVIFGTAMITAGAIAMPGLLEGKTLVAELSPFRAQIVNGLDRKSAVRTIAFGDSHTGLGFYAEPMDGPAYSLGWPDVLVDIDARVTWAIEHFPQLRTAVLQIQPHMFFPHRDRAAITDLTRGLVSGDPNWNPLAGVAYQFDACCRAQMPEWIVRKLRHRSTTPDPLVLENGYLVYDYHTAKGMQELAALEIAGYGHAQPVASLISRFERIVGRLLDRGKIVILTRYPLSLEYRRQLGESAFAAANAFEASLKERYPALQSCGRWDWSDDDRFFLNSDHLTPEGARAYWPVLRDCIARASQN
jgi:hypothetical protein